MKNQKTQSKLLIAMSAVILLLVALSATLTFAWFTASQNSTENTGLEFGKLVLNGEGGTGITATGTSGGKVIPGSTLGISGSASISSNIDYFVRANFVVQILNQNAVDISTKAPAVGLPTANQETVTAASNAATEAASYRGIIMNELFASGASANEVLSDYFSGDNWLAATGSNDGFKYYTTKKLAADNALLVFDFSTEASALLEQADYGNAWQGLSLVVTLTIQAIQADHLLAAGNAEIEFETTAGDDQEINGNVLTQAGVNKLATATAWADATVVNNVTNPVAVPNA
jgi:hypothetical protein